MKDFTLEIYEHLCKQIIASNFDTLRFDEYFTNPNKHSENKLALIRHDVDLNPYNSLIMARLENKLGIKSTYYFRTRKNVLKKKYINEISGLGHEIGFHYETLSDSNGNVKKAIDLFSKELEKLRKITPIKTICMHGSPFSKWRNSDIWKEYNFSDFNILGEAFLSVDYEKVVYFTDTGRSWKNDLFNIRDRVHSQNIVPVNSTQELISKLKVIDSDISINVHPQRWHNNLLLWYKEYFSQNIKNVGKKFLKKIYA